MPFSKGGPAGGGNRSCRGQSPHTPSESPRHFAARRDESVIVGYYTSAEVPLPTMPRTISIYNQEERAYGKRRRY